ncbi:MAG: hypothetical protein ACYCSQ_05115 [bacterium]
MEFIKILEEMIKDDAQEKVQTESNRRIIVLSESDPAAKYSVKIINVPDECVAIKFDSSISLQSIFSGVKGECKRADYIIAIRKKRKDFIIVIELKAGECDNSEVIQQLKGGKCFAEYLSQVTKSFYDYQPNSNEPEYRFVILYKINIPKKGTKPFRLGDGSNIHNQPHNALKISSAKSISLNRLIY